MMAGTTFLQFGSWDEFEEYCKKNSYKIVYKRGYSIIADIHNQSDVLIGYVSDKPQEFRPVESGTKYILVWE